MSCMIQKSENTAAIAGFIEELLNMGFDYHGFEPPKSLAEALKDLACYDKDGFFSAKKIYYELARLNYMAYTERYQMPCISREIPEYKKVSLSARKEYANHHYIIADWHYRIYKMIAFFNYQCDEDATASTALYKATRDLEDRLAAFIVQNTEAYNQFYWE